MQYKCCHCTNSIEGGIHQNIIWWFGAFNAGPESAVGFLCDYCLDQNLKVTIFVLWSVLLITVLQVGTLNCTGVEYLGSLISGPKIIYPTSLTSHPQSLNPFLQHLGLVGGSMEITLFGQQRYLESFPCLNNFVTMLA
jgi:hypothetical protein